MKPNGELGHGIASESFSLTSPHLAVKALKCRHSVYVGGNVLIKEGGPAASGGTFICSGGGPFTPCEVALLNITILGGNVQVEKMTGDVAVGDVFIGGTRVRTGNLKVEDNFVPAGSLFQIRNNDVAEDLQVFKNKGPGSKTVDNNRVGENLQCFENDSPFNGGPNIAGKSEGQCF